MSSENEQFTIRAFKGGFDNNFTYLVTCRRSGAQALVDASVPSREVRSHLKTGFSTVLITHTHGDHIAYLDEYLRLQPTVRLVLSGRTTYPTPRAQTHYVHDGDRLTVGELEIEVLHTPGHYPDSLCFRLDNILFTGDTLFVGRTGRTIGSGSNTRQLYQSVYTKILTLPESTLIYPGHDYGPQPVITLGENIRISPLLQATDEDDFVQRMADYEAHRKST
jgi:glyoxylase-like metal-dependent hydrolase (beta-lactamase superfamily II)